MKEKYVDVKVRTIEFLRGDAVLNAVGSITETNIVVDSGNVHVDALEPDPDFEDSDSPFKEIVF